MVKKVIRVTFVALLIVGLLIGTKQILNANTKVSDPLEKLLKDDNYPYNGYYNPNSNSINETELKDKLLKIDGIHSHVENLEIHILSADDIKVSCKLKEIDSLLENQSGLSSYATWAKTFEGQSATAVFALQKAKDGTTDLIVKSAKISSISIDPQLITPLIKSSNTVKKLNSIPFDSIKCECGIITFDGELPDLFQ